MPQENKRPWQTIRSLPTSEIAAAFQFPPPENCIAVWWGWCGPVTEKVIATDLDALHAMGFRSVLIEAGYDMAHPYLSNGWFQTIKLAAEHAKRRGMRVWVEDEGKYPSGFAGGKFTKERPDLSMQALLVAQTIKVTGGEKLTVGVSDAAVGAITANLDDQTSHLLPVDDGELRWTAPRGNWEVRIIEHQFKTSQTRSVNNPTRGKDETNSLCDYLNPEASKQFIAWTHEQYKKHIGSEFGRTFMGFMSDEPDFARMPWTARLPDEFIDRKGYDVRPWLAAFFAPQPNEQTQRVKADFWDVWSDMFREGFFGQIGRWCRDNGVEYIAHLNCEDRMPVCVRAEGDFFRQMREVHMPGIDTIWDQIWPGKVSDFPRLASSAAHLFGRPRAFSESFAAYKPIPNVEQARWIINYQLVRGINMFLIMYYACSVTTGEQQYPFFASPDFPALVSYANRACYLLSMGRPAAKIALYHPTTSIWLGDDDSNTSLLDIARKLSEQQRDFDFVDEYSLSSMLTLKNGTFTNLSGQNYCAVIIPSVTAISKAALDRLKSFAASGGSVIFLGRLPRLLVEKTFLHASAPDDVSWATCEPSGQFTPDVINALPRPDVVLSQPCPEVKYLHRKWKDADFYFLFNEGEQHLSLSVLLEGSGQAQLWDPASGTIEKAGSDPAADGMTEIHIDIPVHGSAFVVLAR